MEELVKYIENVLNKSTTENGALGYITSGSNLLDLNFSTSSLRNASDDTIIDKFLRAYEEDNLLAIKWLFFARDVRGGLGEKRIFRVIMNYIFQNKLYHKNILSDIIHIIPEYGSWKDIMWLLDKSLLSGKKMREVSETILRIINNQLIEDKRSMNKKIDISLLAKWLPSINTSSLQSKKLAKLICKYLRMDDKVYRKTLSRLRAYIKIVEQKMSSRKWNKIDYSIVPSRANLIYSKAFLRHDKERREEYLQSVSKGESKINAGTLYPYDIVHKYDIKSINQYVPVDDSLEVLWSSLPNNIPNNESTIVVADGSGSMLSTIGNSSLTALEVANSLAIYFAEKLNGPFKNKYITFSKNPQLVDLSKYKTLRDKLMWALRYNEISNTDIEKVFGLILNICINNKLNQSDMPSNIIIISDMEFDMSVNDDLNKSLFDQISIRYNRYGYKLPRLVFWNVNSRTNLIPITRNEYGIALVSGFSPSIADMILSNKLDPLEVLLDKLNSKRYSLVKWK